MTRETFEQAKEIIAKIEELELQMEELAVKNWSDIYIHEKLQKELDELNYKLYHLN